MGIRALPRGAIALLAVASSIGSIAMSGGGANESRVAGKSPKRHQPENMPQRLAHNRMTPAVLYTLHTLFAYQRWRCNLKESKFATCSTV
jgi:hypothetical protein